MELVVSVGERQSSFQAVESPETLFEGMARRLRSILSESVHPNTVGGSTGATGEELELLRVVSLCIPFAGKETVSLRTFFEDIGKTVLSSAVAGVSTGGAIKPIWKVFEEILKDIPEEELCKLPVDGAERHDYYIYGIESEES